MKKNKCIISKGIVALMLIVIQTAQLSAQQSGLTKCDVLSVQDGIYYLDGAPFAEISWNKFDINWMFFNEVYAGRSLDDNNEMVIKQRNSIQELAESGFKTIRFFGMVHPSGFHTKWLPNWEDPLKRETHCNAPMDKAIAICEEYNIRAVISLFAHNFVNKSVVPAEHLRDLVANPTSQSRIDMYAYLDYVINRYKDRKGVLAWEIGNEITLKTDIQPGTRIQGGENMPTATELAQFYKDVCDRIKSIDTLRMVTSGGSILREHAYGLSQLTPSQTTWPARDTYSQHKSMYAMYYQNTGFDNVNIHFYLKKAPNYQIRNDDGTPLQLNEYLYNNLSESISKPLMIGEYGAIPKVDKTNKTYWLTGDDWFTTFAGESDTAQMYVQEAADRAVDSGCRLIYWWCYDSHRPQDQNNPERMDLDKTRTPILFQKIVDANERLKIKYNIIPKLAPEITQVGNDLVSDAPLGNQWCDNFGIISGETEQAFTPLVSGNYYVIVTTDCGSDTSNTINFTLTGIELIDENKIIKVFPNPVSNELVIEIEGNDELINFEIISAIGSVVYNGNLITKTIVQTNNFSDGAYLIKFGNGKTYQYKKIIKE